MYEALLVCQTKGVMAKELQQYSVQHFDHKQKTKGLVVRSPKDLWRSTSSPKVSQTNGLIAQLNQCSMEPCPQCKRKDAAHHPVAPPPPPTATCGDCANTFEYAKGNDSRYCKDCKQKRSDEAYARLVASGRIKPEEKKQLLAAFSDPR
jgi:hypothetical protein